MSTQTVIPDKLRALLALSNSGPALQTTDPSVTQGIPNVPVPPMPPQAMQRLAVPDQSQNTPPPAPVSMPSGAMPNLPALGTPNVALDPQVAQTQGRTLGDMQRLQYLTNSGSGASQVGNPVDKTTGLPTGQTVSGLRRFGGVLARIGDTALSIVSPGVAALTPGTELHHRLLMNQQTGQVNNDLADQQQQAQTSLLDAEPQLKQMGAENNMLKTQGLLGHYQDQANHWDDQTDQQLAAHGYKKDPQGKITPMSYQELPPTLQAVEDLKQSQAELADANKSYTDAKAKNLPLQMQMASQRIATAQRNALTAMGNLGVRKSEYDMHAFGTDASGNELPGVLHDAAGNPVGSTQAGNVKPTTTMRDAAGRAEDLTAIQGRIQAALKDPEIQQYMGPIGGRLAEAQGTLGTLPAKVAQFQNDLVSYGAFQAGLHPVRGIGALQYFDKVMGGLHQTPEQLSGKLASNAATAGTVQQEGTMPTAGGIARRATAPNAPLGGGSAKTDYVYVPGKGLVKQ